VYLVGYWASKSDDYEKMVVKEANGVSRLRRGHP
jgi:hypothetical protein